MGGRCCCPASGITATLAIANFVTARRHLGTAGARAAALWGLRREWGVVVGTVLTVFLPAAQVSAGLLTMWRPSPPGAGERTKSPLARKAQTRTRPCLFSSFPLHY